MGPEEIEKLAELNQSIRYELGVSCLKIVLRSILDDGYYQSIFEKKQIQGIRNRPNVAILLDDKDKILNFFVRSMSTGFNSKDKDFEIIINDNILSLLSSDMVNNFKFPHTNTQTYIIKFTIDLDFLSLNKNEFFSFIQNYLSMVSKLPFIDFQIYAKDKEDKKPSMFVIGKSILGWTSDVSRDEIRAFVLTNPMMAEGHRKDLEASLKEPIVVSSPFYKQVENYMTSSSSSNRAIFYMPEIPLCVADQDFRDRLLEDSFITKDEHRAGTMMHSFFSTDKLRQASLVLNKKGLADIFNHGIVKGCGGIIKLNDTYLEEFKRQIMEKLLVKTNNKDSLNKISCLDMPNEFPRVMVYSDGDKSFYIRPIQQNPYSEERLYYTVQNETISHYLYEYLKSAYLTSDDLAVF